MIRITCLYSSLAEILGPPDANRYEALVNPIDYEFDLVRNEEYIVLGVLTRNGTPWLYVSSLFDDDLLEIVPAILFDFTWREVPDNWAIQINQNDIELLPSSLRWIEGWYERFIDEDPEVVEIVKNQIHQSQ